MNMNDAFLGSLIFNKNSGGSSVTSLYTINQSQGGAWISTGISANSFDNFLFVFNDETVLGNYLMRQIPTSDIVVSSGGSAEYTTIFTGEEIGKVFNVRIYNGILDVSFDNSGASTKKVMVCNPIEI
jgi:hypothetical protein